MSSGNDTLIEQLMKLIEEANKKQTAEIKSEIQAEVSGIKTEISELKKIIQVSTNKIEELERKQLVLEEKCYNIEKYNKRNNILIFGLDNENQDNLAEYTITKLNTLLGLNLTLANLNNVYQIGKRNNKKTLLVQFLSFLTRTQVLRECKKLKGTGIGISADLTKEDREIQKILLKHKKLAQNRGYKAYIRKNKLYINNDSYTAEELEKSSGGEQESRHINSKLATKSNSAPSTPHASENTKEIEDEMEYETDSDKVEEIVSGKEECIEEVGPEEDTNKKRRKKSSSTYNTNIILRKRKKQISQKAE